jgi:hypothetical protein
VVFVTEDVTAKFHDWCRREVRFHHPRGNRLGPECSRSSTMWTGTPLQLLASTR